MTLHALYEELRTLPHVAQREEEANSKRVFERLIDLLASPDLLPSQGAVHALIEVLALMMKQHIVSFIIKPEIPTVTFALGLRLSQPEPTPVVVGPSNYLEQVRENPLQALGGVVFIASYVRDFACKRLDRQRSLRRARAFEAEFLQQMRLCHEREGLPWEPNTYQQSILQEYPEGQASLSPELAYPTPILTILSLLPEEGNNE